MKYARAQHSKDMSPGNSLPDGSAQLTPTPQCPRPSFTTPPTRVLAPRQSYDSVTSHSRRLNLRNAGFRAALLPPRRITPLGGSSATISESLFTISPGNDENGLYTAEHKTSRPDTSCSTSILQEISNSARRRQKTMRPTLGSIFHDDSSSPRPRLDTTTDYLPSSSTQDMPDPLPNVSRRRKDSRMEKMTESSDSPLTTQAKGRRRTRTSLRSNSFEASQYIEHLESEMVSLSAKLESLTSPLTTTSQAAKIRSLNRQISTFRQELADWDTKFEDRVNEEVFQRTCQAADSNAHVKALEASQEAQAATIRELQCELDTARTKLAETESLEASLGRRVDVLTELLAQSPTRLTFPSMPTPSTLEAPGLMSPPRPRLPTLPTSPCAERHSTEVADDPLSCFHGPSLVKSDTLESSEHIDQVDLTADNQTYRTHKMSISISTRSSSENATSYRSAASSSRPTSFTSNSSYGVSWGLSQVSEETRSNSRLRKMRRFGPGSTCLKPLILPTAASLPQSLPASAPVRLNFQTPFREPSGGSVDPTTSLLSAAPDSPPSPTPTRPRLQSLHQRRTSLNRRQALDDLEGKPSWVFDIGTTPSDRVNGEGCVPNLVDSDSPPSFVEAGDGRTLQTELDMVGADAMSEESSSFTYDPQDGLSSFNTRPLQITPPKGDLGTILMGPPPVPSRLQNGKRRRVPSAKQAESTPSTPSKTHSDKPGTKPHGQDVVISSAVVGMLGQINGFIASLRQRPINLAKRIIVSTWSQGSSGSGGLGWWLLRLAFGPRKRKRTGVADEGTAADADASPNCNERRKRARSVTPPEDDYWKCNRDDESQPRGSQREVLTPDVPCSSNLSPRPPSQEYEGIRNRQTKPRSYPKTRPEKTRDPLHSPYAHSTKGCQDLPRSADSPVRCPKCVEPPSKRTLKLWCKFSLAVILAIGVAVIEGPGALLGDEVVHEQFVGNGSNAESRGTSPRRELAGGEREGNGRRLSGIEPPCEDEGEDEDEDETWTIDQSRLLAKRDAPQRSTRDV